MTPTTCVYDLVPPRRPGIDDVGGGLKEDDQEFPPNPVTDPTAADDNQKSNLTVKAHQVIPHTIISVHFAAGTPSINKFQCMVAAVSIPTFTVTDNGPSDTSITWPAGTFPPAVLDADGAVTGATAGTIAVESITNGVRIRTSGTDLPFNVKVY